MLPIKHKKKFTINSSPVYTVYTCIHFPIQYGRDNTFIGVIYNTECNAFACTQMKIFSHKHKSLKAFFWLSKLVLTTQSWVSFALSLGKWCCTYRINIQNSNYTSGILNIYFFNIPFPWNGQTILKFMLSVLLSHDKNIDFVPSNFVRFF